jgi:oligopeptide transport system substrate-binding protein
MKKRVTLTISMLLCMTFVLFVGGCKESSTGSGNDKSSAAISVEQKIIFIVNNEAEDMDPTTSQETFALPVINNCFMGLFTTDDNGALVPGLAESYEVSADRTVYTFKIRDNAKWSDGQDLTADDFVYSWLRVMDPKVASQSAGMMKPYIKNGSKFWDGEVSADKVGLVALDAKTFQVTLEGAIPQIMQVFNIRCFYPVRKDVVEANPDGWHRDPETFISNGPFKVKELNFSESVVLVKNEYFWNVDEVKLEEITFRTIPELTTALTAMETGDVDGIYEVPGAEVPRLRIDSDEFYILPACGTTYYLLNNNSKGLDDVRTRMALSLALDRNEILDIIAQGIGVPALGLIPPGLVLDGKDFREGTDYAGVTAEAQPEKARQLLAEAGYPNGEGFPSLRLGYYTNPRVKKLVEVMQQMWKKNLNIDVVIENAEWQVFFADVQNHDYDIAAMGNGADYTHPSPFLESFGADDPVKFVTWDNTEFNKYMDAALKSTDEKSIAANLHKAEDLLLKESNMINLYHRGFNMMMGNHVKNWRRDVLNMIFFHYAYVE